MGRFFAQDLRSFTVVFNYGLALLVVCSSRQKVGTHYLIELSRFSIQIVADLREHGNRGRGLLLCTQIETFEFV